jgi:hypothetical protein
MFLSCQVILRNNILNGKQIRVACNIYVLTDAVDPCMGLTKAT